MLKLEEKFGKGRIFEKDNFYSNPEKKYRPYRVITYTVEVDGVPCEIQISTLRSSIVADLEHNARYKPNIHPDLPQKVRDHTLDFQRSSTASEHTELAK